MNGIALILRVLRDGETELAEGLLATGQRHRAEHEIFHVSTDLAQWSREHAQRIAEAIEREDHARPEEASGPHSDLVPRSQNREPRPERACSQPALLLLRDLRDLHLGASANSLYWEMLAQAAQARTDTRLLSLVSACHPQTVRQMRWTNTMIKSLAPQLLTNL
ncbi:hypothetical protein [Streptomyces sp. NBC_00306]|uniref:hypothetical protein n=1 Tax=Streptomyces sp. NBC_00306 TaxID=2975708 RepID=UPI002E2C932B|nr:hypothetical protein [Streptomyces sp. NBC_00306]